MTSVPLRTGRPWPLGAHATSEGVNLAVWAPDATTVEWCVFDDTGTQERERWPLPVCTDGVWHGLLPGADAGLVYGLRAHGPWAPEAGHRFNPAKVLLDPYAREVVGRYAGDLSAYRGDNGIDNAATALKARVVAAPNSDPRPRRPERPWRDTVLYEVHVKAATLQHPGVPAPLRGTYAGLAHPAFIAHLQRLGITAVSLLPVAARADEERLQALGLSNHWGYSPIGYCAPEPRYWSGRVGSTPTGECREMVDALHAAGIEVILDVVYNHTAETDEFGPTLSLRGLANARCYRLEDDDPGRYVNWAGCGNVLDLREPRVVQLVIESLRHWAEVIGVDGFRFDLAPILGRGGDGGFTRAAGFFAALQADPLLSRLKLIAEPWDIGPGGYQLGAFPPGWAEWNDRWRDGLRRWWLQPPRDSIDRGELAHRLAGSSTEFRHERRGPWASVNFLTAHDGFTLRDLLSYEHKRNEANGEGNRDGHGHNLGWHCGHEGPTDDPAVLALRQCLSRALLSTLLLGQGTPMLLAGDELGHSQQGNNNAYCQDNRLTWLDWGGNPSAVSSSSFVGAASAAIDDGSAQIAADAAPTKAHPIEVHPIADPTRDDLIATVARLTRLRREHLADRLGAWWDGPAHVRWLDAEARPLEGEAWQRRLHDDSRCLQVLLPGATAGGSDALLVLNAGTVPQRLVLPAGAWHAAFCSEQPGGAPLHSLSAGVLSFPAHALWLLLGVPELDERAMIEPVNTATD